MDSGVSSGYHSLDRKTMMVPSSSGGYPDPSLNYYPQQTQMNPTMAMENIPPYQVPQYPVQYPNAYQYASPAQNKQRSPGRRPNPGYITPQQQIIQQQQQKIQLDQSMAMNCGAADPFRNWNLGANPLRNSQGPPSVHSLSSNMSSLSMMSRATRLSTVSVRTDIDDSHVQYRESVINTDSMLSPEMFARNVEALVQSQMMNPDLAKAVLYYLDKRQHYAYDAQKPLQSCAKLYDFTVKTVYERHEDLKRCPELHVSLFGIWYYLMKMPAMKDLTERLLKESSRVVIMILAKNLGHDQRQNKYCLQMICKILRQLFNVDDRKPVLRFLNTLYTRAFAKECRRENVWKTIASNLPKYSNQAAAIEALRLIFKTPSRGEERIRLMKEFVHFGGLQLLLQCVLPGKYEATLFSSCCFILDLVNDNAIAKLFVKLGGVIAVGHHLDHESPPLVRKVARILRDTSSDDAMEQQDRAQLESVIFKAISNLRLPDKVCVEHVSGFLCNVARISWVKLQTHFLNFFRDHFVYYSRPLNAEGLTVIKVLIDVLQSTYSQHQSTQNRDETKMIPAEVSRKRERLIRLERLAERTVQFFAQVVEVHQTLIPTLNRHSDDLKDVLGKVTNLAPEKFLQPLRAHLQKHEDREQDYDYIEFDKPRLL
uniref:Uncharacterized protein n=1 Tax=Bursaphelenchus xylophilus TaxID=6326 RepID=A0A1I7RUU4_BURXY